MVYQLKCAWCGKEMGVKEGPENSFSVRLETQGLPIISHGMCEACKKKVLDEIRSKDKGGSKDDEKM